MILTSEPTLDAEGGEEAPSDQNNSNKQKIVWNAEALVQFQKEGEAGSSSVSKHREAFQGKSILKKQASIKKEEVDSMVSIH